MALEPAFTLEPKLPREGRKYFTVAEANRALPYVKRIVTDIATVYRQAMSLRQRIEEPQRGDAAEDLRTQYDAAMDRLNGFIDELRLVGVELKDFEKGLLDFPAVHEGREVLLCWHAGETSVHAWHEVDAGFAGRQDVSLLES